MRILTLRFKNLNSLYGEWSIDFTTPEYTADGIFAITGPTGAGKSTILDAICLALYGCTPRLGKITQTTNGIMSQQTGECFAEVMFESQTGRFRCHWSQHRARKKPDGNLIAPRHEIADGRTGQALETHKAKVLRLVEQKTGMGFERFTRSMLLAQGDFAAFLNATADERSPILEQITGTDIYSKISIAVHERKSAEGQQLELLQAELKGITLLTPEEEQGLAEELRVKKEEGRKVASQLEQLNRSVTWLDNLTALKKQKETLEKQKAQVTAELEAFEPDRKRLNRALKALELVESFARLKELRQAQAKDKQTVAQEKKELPKTKEALQTKHKSWEAARETLKAKQQKATEQRQLIQQIRNLDLRIAERQNPIEEKKKNIEKHETELSKLRAQHTNNAKELKDKKERHKHLESVLEKTKADEALVKELGSIEADFDHANSLLKQRTEKRKLTATQQKALETAENEMQTAQKAFAEKRKHVATQERELTQKRSALEKELNGKDLEALHNEQTEAEERKRLLKQLISQTHEKSELTKAIADLDTQIKQLKESLTELSAKLNQTEEREKSQEQRVDDLQTQLNLLQKIKSYEKDRANLPDGTPCPLCGATEHPYAEGAVPTPDETTTELKTVKVELKQTRKDLSDLHQQKTRTETLLSENEKARSEKDLRYSQLTQAQQEACDTLEISAASVLVQASLEKQLASSEKRANDLAALIKRIHNLQNEKSKCQSAYDKTKDELNRAELNKHKAEAHHQEIRLKHETTENDLDRTSKEIKELQEKIQQKLLPYNIKEADMAQLPEIRHQLQTRRDEWLNHQKEATDLTQELAALTHQCQTQSEQIKQIETTIQSERETLKNLTAKHESLQKERHDLFGDQSPDTVEKALNQAIDRATQHFEETRIAYESLKQELRNRQTRITGLEEGIAARLTILHEEETAFLTEVHAAGFIDESDFIGARLNPDERHQLQEKAQSLDNQSTHIETQLSENTKTLAAETDRALTDEKREDLQMQIDKTKQEQNHLSESIGALHMKLRTNETQKEKQKAQLAAQQKQEEELQKWTRLHTLIGSADGKKFRNFAQGLTFEIMVGHANQQLRKMTDRYLLIRDATKPLDLNVVDNYQAGEIRSTRNLSGGESFLISLALSLGLSQMASRNVKVDSLFLDEGFGTLDEEALETALETLSNLQQDGKLIGVISHVSALKERIRTQLNIDPVSGGRSRLAGPGCISVTQNEQ